MNIFTSCFPNSTSRVTEAERAPKKTFMESIRSFANTIDLPETLAVLGIGIGLGVVVAAGIVGGILATPALIVAGAILGGAVILGGALFIGIRNYKSKHADDAAATSATPTLAPATPAPAPAPATPATAAVRNASTLSNQDSNEGSALKKGSIIARQRVTLIDTGISTKSKSDPVILKETAL